MNVELTRRNLLKGLGASAFTFAVAGNILSRSFAAPGPGPKRLIIFGDYSWQPQTYLPDFVHGLSKTLNGNVFGDDISPRSVQAWPEVFTAATAYMDRAVMVDGCRLTEFTGFNNSHGAGTGWLSAMRPSGKKGPVSVPAGITIDEFIGQQLRGDTPYPVIRCGMTGSAYGSGANTGSNIFAAGPDQALPHLTSSIAMVDTYFQGMSSGDTMAAPNQFRSIRDLLQTEFKTLHGRLAAEERIALETYESVILEFDKQQERLASLSCDQPTLPADVPPVEDEVTSIVRLAGLAMRCGLTNVIAISLGQVNNHNKHRPIYTRTRMERCRLEENRDPNDGAKKAYGHAFGSYDLYADAFMPQQQIHVEALTELMDMLSATPENNGTMMDNTAVVYMTGNSVVPAGHHINRDDFPALLIAGANTGFNTGGRYMRFLNETVQRNWPDGQTPRHLTDFYRSLALGLGADPTGFRDDAPRSMGSIPEILS